MFFESLALITSVTNALGSVMIAKGMKGASPTVAAFYSVLVQAAILTALLIISLPPMSLIAASLFVLGGFLSLGLGRLLYFVAMRSMGVAKASAVIGSSPVITTLLSIIILSEQPAITTFFGAVTVASGIALISGAESFKVERALFIGLVSTFSYAMSNIVSKMGLNVQPDPFLSAQAGAAAGLLFFLIYITLTGQTSSVRIPRTSLLYFCATGVFSSVGWLAMMKALELGSVSIVTTIVYSYPLFSLAFTRMMIKEEKLSRRLVVGSVLVVIGVAVVALL